MTDLSDTDQLGVLVPRAVSGDAVALNTVFVLVQPYVRRYCAVKLGSADQSIDDIVQDVIVALMTAIPNYRDMGKPFLSFVFGIAAHKLIDARRMATRRRYDPIEAVAEKLTVNEGPEDHVLAHELQREIGSLMGTLPALQRQIIFMRVVWQMTAPQTGAALGMSAGAVRIAQHRALSQLRRNYSIEEALGVS